MKVLWYIAVPIILVTVYCVVMWMRNRKPTSLQSGVEAFRREMRALSPDAARQERRQPHRSADPSPAPPGPPSRRR